MRRSRAAPVAAIARTALLAFAATGCTLLAPSAMPAGSGTASSVGPPATTSPAVLGLDWARVTSVERPANFDATVPPSYPGVHPILRIAGQATMTDVDQLSRGGYVAIGYAPPTWQPVAWTS